MTAAPVYVQWGIAPTIRALSEQLVNELRLAGFPELEGGGILWGKANQSQRKSPPSIVAVWAPSGAMGVEYHWEAQNPGAHTNLVPSGGRPVEPVLSSLATDLLRIDFYVWAAMQPPDPQGFGDADACRYLCHQLWRVIHRGCEGSYKVLGTDPSEQPPTSLGAQAVLRVEFSTPVVDELISYVLPGTTSTTTVSNQQNEVAAIFTTPGVN